MRPPVGRDAGHPQQKDANQPVPEQTGPPHDKRGTRPPVRRM